MSATDFLYIGAALLVFGICLFTAYSMINSLVGTPLDTTYPDFVVNTSPIAQGQDLVKGMDWLTVVLAFGMSLAVFAASFFVRSHPIYAIIALFFSLIWFIIATPIANAWITSTNLSVFSSFAGDFPLTNAIIINFPLWSWLLGLLSGIIFYGKQENFGAAGI